MLLITVEKTLNILEITSSAETIDQYSRLINAISVKIEQYCKRDFEYKENVSEIEYLDTELVRIPKYPVMSVSTMQIASSLKLDDLIDVDFFRLTNIQQVFVETLLGYGIIQATYLSGYVLPKYEGVATPTGGTIGDYWLDYTGMILKQLDSTGPDVWLTITDILPLPETIQEAVVEYIYWVNKRLKQKVIGIKEKSRGYGYEGSTMVMERKMPDQIKEMLEDEVNYG